MSFSSAFDTFFLHRDCNSDRRIWCGAAIVVWSMLIGGLPGSASGQAVPRIQVGRLRVELERLLSQVPNTTLFWPASMDTEGNGSGRLFFAEIFGRVRILDDGSLGTFLDLTSEVKTATQGGFLGLAFHPGYSDPLSPGYRKLYTYHTTSVDAGAPVDFSAAGTVSDHNVLTEWQVDANNPDQVDLSTRREVFREAHIGGLHHGGMLTFGPDGYLYGTIGTPPQGASLLVYAQDLSIIQGKVFRIDPLDPSLTVDSMNLVSANGKYRIPADNPFVDEPSALDEVYATGVRNLYRFSIDPVSNLLFGADVGQASREEVSVIPAGGNMGWPHREGSTTGPVAAPDPPPSFVEPIAEYTHADGRTVVGGYVYRGSIPELQGKYIFGEFSWGSGPFVQSRGRLLWLDPFDESGMLKDSSEIQVYEMLMGPDSCAVTLNSSGACSADVTLLSFGVDDDGELYFTGIGGGNTVYKFTSAFFLPEGDYNEDGTVDAADYTLWRDTQGQEVRIGSQADGNGNGIIDVGDYEVWLAHFGETIAGAGSASGDVAAVPEPLTGAMLIIGVLGCSLFPRRSRRR